MKNLKWGLIGAGNIARKRIAPALRDLPNGDFVAVSRARSDLAEAFAAEFGARKWFADTRAMLDDDEIEAVYIASPVFLHAEQTIRAAERGKHVLCEKPMALNVAECDAMLAACRANNVRLGIAYYRRFYPLIERIKEITARGEIGKIVLAQINAFEFFDPAPENARRWLIEKEKSGGGPMMDFGCHRLEVLTNLFGAVRELKSLTSNAVFKRAVEDTAIAAIQFESGVGANLTVTHAAFETRDTLDIFGSEGSIHVPVLNGSETRIITKNGARVEHHAAHKNVHQPLIEDFTEAVLTGRESRANGEIGRMIAVLEANIYENTTAFIK